MIRKHYLLVLVMAAVSVKAPASAERAPTKKAKTHIPRTNLMRRPGLNPRLVLF